MTVEFTLPDIGEGLHEAEIVRWMVAEGQEVARNQPFVEIMTDKSSVEMPAPAAGVVARLVPAEGDLIQVGDLLIVIDDGQATASSGGPGAATGSSATTAPAPVEAPAPAIASAPARPTAPPQPPSHRSTPADPATAGPVEMSAPARPVRPKASPSTRRLAAELGVDLTVIRGTGPGGRILADDVTAAADEPAARPGPAPGVTSPATAPPGPATRAPASSSGLGWMAEGVHPLRGIRRATARAMDRSWSTIPHISASREIDASPLLEARRQLVQAQEEGGGNGAAPARITPLALVILAVARALRRYPMMNASLDLEAETITVPDRINVGVAVATDHGLLVPVIADADRLGLGAVAAELGRLSAAARDQTIRLEEQLGGTHTITNYGSAGGHLAAPIIRPGEAAITGLGGIDDRPIVVDGEVVARPTLPVVVCADHRLIDGDVMSAFHGEVCRTLSNPIGLLL